MKEIGWGVRVFLLCAIIAAGLGFGSTGATRGGGFDTRLGILWFLMGAGIVVFMIGMLLIPAYANRNDQDNPSEEVVKISIEELQMRRRKCKKVKLIFGWMIILLCLGTAWGVRDWFNPAVSYRDAGLSRVCLSALLIYSVTFIFFVKEDARLSKQIEQLKKDRATTEPSNRAG
jgi:hypothetical protein